jgi:3-dehydroquinate dehydratase-2
MTGQGEPWSKGVEMARVMVLNGVNLGRLGVRQPGVYGHISHAELADHLVETGRGMGLEVEVRHTDAEAELIGWLHEAADAGLPVVLNPGAWSHYSYALADAAREIDVLI